MGWLARLDRRADRWPLGPKCLYFVTKFSLILFGGFALLRLWLDRIGLWPLYR